MVLQVLVTVLQQLQHHLPFHTAGVRQTRLLFETVAMVQGWSCMKVLSHSPMV